MEFLRYSGFRKSSITPTDSVNFVTSQWLSIESFNMRLARKKVLPQKLWLFSRVFLHISTIVNNSQVNNEFSQIPPDNILFFSMKTKLSCLKGCCLSFHAILPSNYIDQQQWSLYWKYLYNSSKHRCHSSCNFTWGIKFT